MKPLNLQSIQAYITLSNYILQQNRLDVAAFIEFYPKNPQYDF